MAAVDFQGLDHRDSHEQTYVPLLQVLLQAFVHVLFHDHVLLPALSYHNHEQEQQGHGDLSEKLKEKLDYFCIMSV